MNIVSARFSVSASDYYWYYGVTACGRVCA